MGVELSTAIANNFGRSKKILWNSNLKLVKGSNFMWLIQAPLNICGNLDLDLDYNPLETSLGNTWTQSLATNFLSFNFHI